MTARNTRPILRLLSLALLAGSLSACCGPWGWGPCGPPRGYYHHDGPHGPGGYRGPYGGGGWGR